MSDVLQSNDIEKDKFLLPELTVNTDNKSPALLSLSSTDLEEQVHGEETPPIDMSFIHFGESLECMNFSSSDNTTSNSNEKILSGQTDAYKQLSPFFHEMASKLYCNGFVNQSIVALPSGDKPPKYKPGSWTRFYAELRGYLLSFWPAGTSDCDPASIRKIKSTTIPTFVTVEFSSFEAISESSAKEKWIISLNTAGENKILLRFQGPLAWSQWIAGLRLCCWEYFMLNKYYTSLLLIGSSTAMQEREIFNISLSNGDCVRVRVLWGNNLEKNDDSYSLIPRSPIKKSKSKDLMNEAEFKQLWMTLNQDRESKLFTICFYELETKALTKTKHKPIAKLSGLLQVAAMFPEDLTDPSTAFLGLLLYGNIKVNSSKSSILKKTQQFSFCRVFLDEEKTKIHVLLQLLRTFHLAPFRNDEDNSDLSKKNSFRVFAPFSASKSASTKIYIDSKEIIGDSILSETSSSQSAILSEFDWSNLSLYETELKFAKILARKLDLQGSMKEMLSEMISGKALTEFYTSTKKKDGLHGDSMDSPPASPSLSTSSTSSTATSSHGSVNSVQTTSSIKSSSSSLSVTAKGPFFDPKELPVAYKPPVKFTDSKTIKKNAQKTTEEPQNTPFMTKSISPFSLQSSDSKEISPFDISPKHLSNSTTPSTPFTASTAAPVAVRNSTNYFPDEFERPPPQSDIKNNNNNHNNNLNKSNDNFNNRSFTPSVFSQSSAGFNPTPSYIQSPFVMANHPINYPPYPPSSSFTPAPVGNEIEEWQNQQRLMLQQQFFQQQLQQQQHQQQLFQQQQQAMMIMNMQTAMNPMAPMMQPNYPMNMMMANMMNPALNNNASTLSLNSPMNIMGNQSPMYNPLFDPNLYNRIQMNPNGYYGMINTNSAGPCFGYESSGSAPFPHNANQVHLRMQQPRPISTINSSAVNNSNFQPNNPQGLLFPTASSFISQSNSGLFSQTSQEFPQNQPEDDDEEPLALSASRKNSAKTQQSGNTATTQKTSRKGSQSSFKCDSPSTSSSHGPSSMSVRSVSTNHSNLSNKATALAEFHKQRILFERFADEHIEPEPYAKIEMSDLLKAFRDWVSLLKDKRQENNSSNTAPKNNCVLEKIGGLAPSWMFEEWMSELGYSLDKSSSANGKRTWRDISLTTNPTQSDDNGNVNED